MNVVLSVALIAFVFAAGIDLQAMQDIPSVVGEVVEGSAGEAAGLMAGDRIVRINGEAVDKWKDVQFVFATSPERPVEVELLRDGTTVLATVTPVKVPRYEFGEAGVYPKLLLRFIEVFSGSPAHAAGFLAGDEVRRVDERPVSDVGAFVEYIQGRADTEVRIEVARGEELLTLAVVPRRHRQCRVRHQHPWWHPAAADRESQR